MIDVDANAITEFLEQRKDDLHRIVGNSRGQWSTGDIPGETWVAAIDVQAKLDRPLDLRSIDDMDLLLRTLRSAA